MEARDHRGHEGFWVNSIKIERVAGTTTEKMHKGQLRSSIALAKGMDGIEIGKEISGSVQKVRFS